MRVKAAVSMCVKQGLYKRKNSELNDICFAEHIFETKMWTFAHCARCCLTHSYPLFGMAQFFVVLWKLTVSPNNEGSRGSPLFCS